VAGFPYWFVEEKTGETLDWVPTVVVAATITIAISVFLDRIADAHDKLLSANRLRASESTAANSASDLNTFLVEAIAVSFLEGTARDKATETLARILTMCAAKSIGPGSRATYYRLEGNAPNRVLGTPVHTTEYGRYDKPKRPFIEQEDPDHPIWGILDGVDEEPEVTSYPTEVRGIEWERKKYRTFLSVPVKANDVAFGLLSVNNTDEGSIGEAQRAVVLAMARTMAVVLALQHGPRALSSLQSRQTTVVQVTVQSAEGEAADE